MCIYDYLAPVAHCGSDQTHGSDSGSDGTGTARCISLTQSGQISVTYT